MFKQEEISAGFPEGGLLSRLAGFFGSPLKVLFLSVVLGVGFVACHLAFSYGIYDDVATCYAPMAQAAAKGNLGGGPFLWLPPLQPLLAGILCFFGVAAATAVMAVSGFFYVAAVGPLYGFLRFFMPGREAAWGCLLYILAPKVMRFGCAGLLEPGRNFFAIAAVGLLLWEWRNRSWWRPALLGLSLGCLAMTRSEGIAFAPPMLFLLCLPTFFKKPSYQELAKMAGTALLAVFVLCAVLLPRMIQVRAATGYLSPDVRMLKFFVAGQSIPNEHPLQITEIETAKPAVQAPPPVSPAPVVVQAPPPPATALPPKTAERVWKERGLALANKCKVAVSNASSKQLVDFLRGSYEVYLALGLIGVVSLCWSGRWRREHFIPLLFAAMSSLSFLMAVSAYRYYTVNLLLFMPFTMEGFVCVAKWIWEFRAGRALLPVALAAVAVCQAVNGMEKVRAKAGREDYALGVWLKAHSAELKRPGADGPLRILSKRPHYAFWADGQHTPLPKDSGQDASRIASFVFDVAVFEKGEGALKASLLSKRPDLSVMEQDAVPGREILCRRR